MERTLFGGDWGFVVVVVVFGVWCLSPPVPLVNFHSFSSVQADGTALTASRAQSKVS